MFNVGDEVKLVKTNGSSKAKEIGPGKTGVVTKIVGTVGAVVVVTWDHLPEGHLYHTLTWKSTRFTKAPPPKPELKFKVGQYVLIPQHAHIGIKIGVVQSCEESGSVYIYSVSKLNGAGNWKFYEHHLAPFEFNVGQRVQLKGVTYCPAGLIGKKGTLTAFSGEHGGERRWMFRDDNKTLWVEAEKNFIPIEEEEEKPLAVVEEKPFWSFNPDTGTVKRGKKVVPKSDGWEVGKRVIWIGAVVGPYAKNAGEKGTLTGVSSASCSVVWDNPSLNEAWAPGWSREKFRLLTDEELAAEVLQEGVSYDNPVPESQF